MEGELEVRAQSGGDQEDGTVGGGLEVVFPSDVADDWSVPALHDHSQRLQALLAEATLDTRALAELRLPAVSAGQVVGRRCERGPGMKAGEGVEAGTAEGEEVWWAAGGGYLFLVDNSLSVLSPVWVDASGLEAYWLLLDTHSRSLTAAMILQQLEAAGVVEGMRSQAIDDLAERVRRGDFRCGAELVAAGRAPVDGRDAQVEILVDVCRLAGKERLDGSLDFRQVDAIATVESGQRVAQRRPATTGTPGRDVRGQTLPAAAGRECSLRAGENVEQRLEEEVEIFLATANGVLRTDQDLVAVTRWLHIPHDVDFKTGNLDFDGEIYVEGAVIQGFSVKASGDITIAGTVESGARVNAGGNLVVGRGIVGRKTQVVAAGSVRAQFVQEATVSAGEDLVVGNYAHQARLRAGRWVRILRGQGAHGGTLSGGQAWAQNGIEAHILGSPSYTPTALMAGVGPEHIRSLERMKEGVDASYNQLRRLLTQFGMARVDVGQIRNMISAASGPRRTLLAARARKLGQVVQVHQKLLAARQQLEEQIGQEMEGAEITALHQAYPGVEICLGKYRRTLREEVIRPCFHVRDGRLIERRNP